MLFYRNYFIVVNQNYVTCEIDNHTKQYKTVGGAKRAISLFCKKNNINSKYN